MSGFLVITPEDREKIKEIVREARITMIPKDKVMLIATDDRDNPSDTLTLKDREKKVSGKKLREVRKGHEVHHIQLGSYDVAFSFEEQPSGIARHISVASAAPGKVPNEFVISMLTREFGFSAWPPERPYRVWIEEYEPGRNAINFVELVE